MEKATTKTKLLPKSWRNKFFQLVFNSIFFQWVFVFCGFRDFRRRLVRSFSYEFINFFETALLFSMKVFVFLVLGVLEDGSVSFFHMNL